MSELTSRDSTIEDIHRTREQMAEKFGHDIGAILSDARKRQEAAGRAIWRGPAALQESSPKVEVVG